MPMSVRSFLKELRRRKVYRVAAAYAAVAFVVWQVADVWFESFGLPERAVGVVLIGTLLGFPVALVLAWAYELKPEAPEVAAPAHAALEGPSRETLETPTARPGSVAI